MTFPMEYKVIVYSFAHGAALEEAMQKLEKYKPQERVTAPPPPPPIEPKADPLGSLHEPLRVLPEVLRMPNVPDRSHDVKPWSQPATPVGKILEEFFRNLYAARKNISDPSSITDYEMSQFVFGKEDPQRSTKWTQMKRANRVAYKTLVFAAKHPRVPIESLEKIINPEEHIYGEIPQARFVIRRQGEERKEM